MTKQEFKDMFGREKNMLVRKEIIDGRTYYLSVDSKKPGKFEIVELDNGWYWVNTKRKTLWSGWEILFVWSDGSYDVADTVHYLCGNEFVLTPIDRPRLNLEPAHPW